MPALTAPCWRLFLHQQQAQPERCAQPRVVTGGGSRVTASLPERRSGRGRVRRLAARRRGRGCRERVRLRRAAAGVATGGGRGGGGRRRGWWPRPGWSSSAVLQDEAADCPGGVACGQVVNAQLAVGCVRVRGL